ncbi:hypothetical protein AP058_01394 [Flavobacterium sp. TAB 87]|nr:hypothetical protein AP058_01394 [Flavobacterium sp. TAB 87]
MTKEKTEQKTDQIQGKPATRPNTTSTLKTFNKTEKTSYSNKKK